MTISAYQRGEISLGKAAMILGISQEEMKDVLREAGSEIHLEGRTSKSYQKKGFVLGKTREKRYHPQRN